LKFNKIYCPICYAILQNVPNPKSPLRLNVGFLINQNIGYSREFPFYIPVLKLSEDASLTELSGTARFTRTPQGLLCEVIMKAGYPAECARCLNPFAQALEINYTELYAFNRRMATESGLLLPEDGHVDLEPLVSEYMLLEVPINPVCKPDCKGLCPVCGANMNEISCGHERPQGDDRLAGLKSLLDPGESDPPPSS